MKRIIFILLLIFNYSCTGQKKSSNLNCNIIATSNLEDFDSVITNIDTTKLFKDVFQDFENIKDGVLFYRLASGNQYGYFTIFNLESSKIYCQKFSKDFNKKISVNEKDNKIILTEINLIKKPNTFYYKQCSADSVDFIYLLVIKKEGKIVSKYLAHSYNDSFEDNKNIDMQSIKNIFEIAYRYSFK